MQGVFALMMLVLIFDTFLLGGLLIFGIDLITLIIITVVVLLPVLFLMFELRIRTWYPIRVRVVYVQGDKDNKGVLFYRDRLGYMDCVDAKGKKTGAKEWRLRKNGKMVSGFSLKDVEEGDEYIFGEILKVAFRKRMANVYAVAGIEGYEFYPARFDTDSLTVKPLFDSDRSAGLVRIQDDIEVRNNKENWWRENALGLFQTGLQAVIIILLIVLIIQLADWSLNFPKTCAAAEIAKVAVNATATPPTTTALLPFPTGG